MKLSVLLSLLAAGSLAVPFTSRAELSLNQREELARAIDESDANKVQLVLHTQPLTSQEKQQFVDQASDVLQKRYTDYQTKNDVIRRITKFSYSFTVLNFALAAAFGGITGVYNGFAAHPSWFLAVPLIPAGGYGAYKSIAWMHRAVWGPKVEKEKYEKAEEIKKIVSAAGVAN